MTDVPARLEAWFAARLPDARDVRLLDGPRRLSALIALIDGAQVSLRILYYI